MFPFRGGQKLLLFFARLSSVSAVSDLSSKNSVFRNFVQMFCISALISHISFLGVRVNLRPFDKSLICPSVSSLEARFTIFKLQKQSSLVISLDSSEVMFVSDCCTGPALKKASGCNLTYRCSYHYPYWHDYCYEPCGGFQYYG